MHFRNIYRWFLCGILCTTFVFQISAQEIRKNERGEKMVVYPDGSWRYFNENTIRPAGTFPVVSDTIGELETPTDLTEEIVRKLVFRQSQIAEEANEVAQKRIMEATKQRIRIEQEIQILKHDQSPSQEELKRMNIRLKAARKTEEDAKREANLAQREFVETQELTQKGNLLEAFVQKQKDRASKIELNVDNYRNAVFDPRLILPEEYRYVSDNPINNVYLNPPKARCKTAFDGIEPNSRRRRKDMQAKTLFTHTDERLRMYMKDNDYLKCNAFLSNVAGGYRLMTLEFKFAYPNAREAYGFIEKGSILTLLFLNGDYINLKSGILANGEYDMKSEILTYRVQYPINQGQVQYLKKNEVDRIRVYWSTGYEEYEVFELDFFMQQASCLGW